MALQSSGSLSMSQINTELTNSSTATLNMGATTVRNLFQVLSGSISFSNGYGKTRVITIPLSFSQGYGSQSPVYYNLGPYSIIGKTTLTGTSLQTVQTLSGSAGSEYHNSAIVDYSYDNSSWTRLVNVGGAGWYNNDPHSRGSTLSTASVSTSVSGTNLYIRFGTWTERGATMTVSGTLTIQ